MRSGSAVIVSGVVAGLLFCLPGTASGGSLPAYPLPEAVQKSAAIVTGRIIAIERRPIRDGVSEVSYVLRVDSALKGEPRYRELTLEGNEPVRTLALATHQGPKVPSGHPRYSLGQEEIWFLGEINPDETARGAYQALACKDRELNKVNQVKELIAKGRARADDKPDGPPGRIKSVRRDAPYQAYWLTGKADGRPSEYGRLLITHGPVEDLAGHKAWSVLPFDNMAMTLQTYERDSLWAEPFRCVQDFGTVDAASKTAVVDGVTYRYDPCPLGDVARLLENPLGTIPIHRREHPLYGAEHTAKAFRVLLREQMKAEK